MNLASAPQVKKLLEEHGLRPKKRLGQNFLIDRNVLNRIVSTSGASPGDHILEIGPGLGTVTLELARAGAAVTCVEADSDLVPVLRDVLSRTDVEIVAADFLDVDLPDFLVARADARWKVAANLPYYITSPILGKLVDAREQLSSMLVMVQREVARRLQAGPGSDDYGALTVFAQFYCEVSSAGRVSRNVFYPVPDVDSELVRLEVRERPVAAVSDEARMFRIVRAAFGKRRKTLSNALSSSSELGWNRETAALILARSGIDGGRRGETLSIDEFAALADAAGHPDDDSRA